MDQKIFMWLNQSYGDLLTAIPVINLLLEKYPDIKIKFACYENQAYLLKHLPLEIVTVKGDYMNIPARVNFFKHINPEHYKDYTPIHMWGGVYSYPLSWRNQVKTFNNQCKDNNLDLSLDENTIRYIELPKIDFDVKERAVYVENGYTVSGHSFFNFNIYKLSLMFPKTNFYITYPVDFTADNVFDCSKMNLIELSNLSKKCLLILGKGSSPYYCTLNEANKDKDKYLFQFRYHFENWLESDKTILLNKEEEMFGLIRPINRQR